MNQGGRRAIFIFLFYHPFIFQMANFFLFYTVFKSGLGARTHQFSFLQQGFFFGTGLNSASGWLATCSSQLDLNSALVCNTTVTLHQGTGGGKK